MSQRAVSAQTFRPEVSLAEYIEIPKHANELRLTFATHAASCERFVPPPTPDDVMVTVVVTLPASKRLEPGAYAWAGHEAHGGKPRAPELPYAFATARIGKQSFQLPPGGGLRIDSVQLDRHGGVSGQLAFEFPGDADQPASSLRGRFSARFCRFDPVEGE